MPFFQCDGLIIILSFIFLSGLFGTRNQKGNEGGKENGEYETIEYLESFQKHQDRGGGEGGI